MAKRPKNKMSVENRAKQFMPFAALKGLEEALVAKEKMIADQIDFSEEMDLELDVKMRQITKGDMISVTYFSKKQY